MVEMGDGFRFKSRQRGPRRGPHRTGEPRRDDRKGAAQGHTEASEPPGEFNCFHAVAMLRGALHSISPVIPLVRPDAGSLKEG